MYSKHGGHHLSALVFVIGLALLMITGWWFPGILFVLGAALIAGAVDQGKRWNQEYLAFMFFGIGLIWWVPNAIQSINWWFVLGVIFLGIALSSLFSKKPRVDDNDPSDDDYLDDADDYHDDDDDGDSPYV